MRTFIVALILFVVTASCSVAIAQETQVSDQDEYTIELPSSLWRAIVESDGGHGHAEFVNGDR
ncbi:MAG TPA: hypothetical protein VGN90_03695, partial [Pyrinomonadaceae bacterium]|nr:hypothetical protein [Pyrinomonadaceae bacterium]